MKYALGMSLALLASSLSALAQDASATAAETPVATTEKKSALSLGLDLGVHSKYVWRGIILNDDPVVQGALNLKYNAGDAGTFGLSLWSNYDCTDYQSERNHITEVDYTLNWSKDLGELLNLELGLVYYDYPEASEIKSDHEVYAKLSIKTVLNPYIMVAHGLDVAYGFYVQAGASQDLYTIEDGFLAGTVFNLSGSIGWADADYSEHMYGGNDSSTLSDAQLTFKATIPLFENCTLAPYVQYVTLLSAARNETFENDDFLCGVVLSYTF